MATSRGLWVDEAISVRQAQLPLRTMLADVRDTDVHPPLHHVLLWVTVRLFGTSEFAVRLPSLIAGIALVPVMGWIGRLLYDRRTGWIAAVLATIAPFGVWYSQEARMYSLFMLFAALAVGAQVQALRRGRTVDWVLYGAATAAMLWTQYFAVLPVLVQQRRSPSCCGVTGHDRRAPRTLLRGWLVASAVVAVASLPLMPILLDQLAAYSNRGVGLTPGQAGRGSSTLGSSISIYAVGANLIWATLGYHADGAMVQLAALWPLLMLLALVMLGAAAPAAASAAGPRRRADDGAVRRRVDEARPVRAALLRRRRAGAAAPRRPRRHVDGRAAWTASAQRRGGGSGAGDRPRRSTAQRRQPTAVRLRRGDRRDRRARRAWRRRALRAGVPGRGRRLLRVGIDALPVGAKLLERRHGPCSCSPPSG